LKPLVHSHWSPTHVGGTVEIMGSQEVTQEGTVVPQRWVSDWGAGSHSPRVPVAWHVPQMHESWLPQSQLPLHGAPVATGAANRSVSCGGQPLRPAHSRMTTEGWTARIGAGG